MPAFSVSPITDIPAPQAEAFPDFIQFQADGENLGTADADTLNFATGLTATRGTGENVNRVTVAADGATITWREVTGSDSITAADLGNAIDANSDLDGTITITVPLDDPDVPAFTSNAPILIFQGGTRAVTIAADDGVTLLLRDTLTADLAGQYATATLIRREADVWILCGDLGAA